MGKDLSNFIKYCLGYIKLTQQRNIALQQKYSVIFDEGKLDLIGLLNGDTDDFLGETINLKTFYKYDPKNVPEEDLMEYEKEKDTANKIEEIYNKYKNDQFTKQIVINFGFIELEVPVNKDLIEIDVENEFVQDTLFLEENKISKQEDKLQTYPIFTLPVTIEKEDNKYVLYSKDPDVQLNLGLLQNVLGDELYYELLEDTSSLELSGDITIPILNNKVFIDIWHLIKAKLKLKDAVFNENSFDIDTVHLSLGPKANYFLAEDLQKLSKLDEKLLEETSLASWTDDSGLNDDAEVPNETDLYFPFLYDKYQLKSLALLNRKCSIIQGPPGTGKSETIANILCQLAANNKKVLFVSQKAQALKAVKDRLNKTEIKYLYGYIPNPNSPQTNEEDDQDGISAQLTSLSSYLASILEVRYFLDSQEDISTVVEQSQKSKKNINEAVENEREYYQINQKIQILIKYKLELVDPETFFSNFSFDKYKQIKEVLQRIVALNVSTKIELDAEEKNIQAKITKVKFTSNKFSNSLEIILKDLSQTGFDRHSKLLRKISNSVRNIRLGSNRAGLPREIIEIADQIVSRDLSRNEACLQIGKLIQCVKLQEDLVLLSQDLKAIDNLEISIGIDLATFNKFETLLEKSTNQAFDKLKKKIQEYIDLEETKKMYVSSVQVNSEVQKIAGYDLKRKKKISKYIQLIINKNLTTNYGNIAFRRVIARLAKAFGHSKRAFKTFDSLRKEPENFRTVMDLIPVWIMELDDASRIIPLEAGMFDYVILDEASQCNIAYTLPAMFRAKHTIFVGDSEQMRDNTIRFKSNKAFDELASRYKVPKDLQIKSSGNAVQSVLDIAELRGFHPIILRYHYRSPAELIGFNNEYFYKPKGKELIPLNNNYLTYEDTNRIMVIHNVKSSWKEEYSDKINTVEAREILKLFKKIKQDIKYDGKSIGILTFFNAQAAYIRDLFEKNGFKESKDNYKISIIEGIQGDEKDIILYSFVIREKEQKNKYIYLTGEGGDINGDINKGRVNVAFSRARLQVHCFTSIDADEFPKGIWLKKYLEYIDLNGEVDFYSKDMKGFDSYFEETFYGLSKNKLPKTFIIQNQVESCGFKIDFVISNPNTGSKIAIECDGPTHFRNEMDEEYGIHVESDEERQRVLMAAGWHFYRIKYSDWINEEIDNFTFIEDIKQMLSN